MIKAGSHHHHNICWVVFFFANYNIQHTVYNIYLVMDILAFTYSRTFFLDIISIYTCCNHHLISVIKVKR